MTDALRVLLIEDTEQDAMLLERTLRRKWKALDLHRIETADDMRAALETGEWDVVLSDFNLPGFGAPEALAIQEEVAPDLPFVVVSGLIATEDAVDIMRAGTHDFVRKDDLARLVPTIERELGEADGQRERKRLETELRDREEHYRTLYRSTPAMMHSIDGDGCIVNVSDYWLEHLGFRADEVIGRKSTEFLTEESRRYAETKVLPAFMRTGSCTNVEYRFVKKNGEIIDTLLSATAERDADGAFVRSLAIVTDVTEKKSAEHDLMRTNRALRTISQCNQVLVRATSEQQLLFDICRTVVEYGGYRMAWVGFPENDAKKSIRPAAHYGHEKGFLELASPTWEDVEGRYCPAGAAIRKGTPQLLQNLADHPEFACDLEAALERGYAACAAFPLNDDDHVFGTLTVFAGEPMAFDDSEAALLQELADDLAYGILALRESAERRRTERELEKAHQRLTSAIESLPDGFAIFDSDDRLVLTNEKYKEIYAESVPAIRHGTTFEELIRFGLDHGQYADAVGREESWLAERLAKRRNPVDAVEQQLPDERWVLVREQRTPDGETVGARTDITELKRAEQAVERSKTILQAILDSTDDTILMLDRKGRVLAINRAGAQRFGQEPADFIGRTMIEFYSGEDAAPRKQAFEEILATGEPIVREFQWFGRTRESKMHPVFGVGKDPVAVTIYSRDITQRRSAEEDLRKLSRAVEYSPAIVIVTDVSGIIEYVNPKFTEVTGYCADEVIGRNPRILKSGDKTTGEYQELWGCLSAGQEWRGEFHNKRKDGGLYWAAASISPIRDDDGRITHFVGIQEDITARREAELKARQADKMESLGNLAGGIAHDLNNMLLPVMLLTGEAKKALPEDNPSRGDLDQVLEVLDRAKDMVSRILAFSRQDEPHQEIADVGELVAQSLPFLRSVVPSTIGIDAAIEPESGFVAVDTTQLHNVLMNLAANATDALEGRTGQIGIAVAAVNVEPALASTIVGLREGRYARVSVSDTGDGMDAETLNRAFDPFFTTKAVGKGTGMGLAMVHGIVTKHGGAVHVESAPGKGTRFDLFFPAAEGQPNDH